MALSEFDRNLLQRCLARKPRAWEEFVDRFVGLVVHVLRHTAQSRSIRLSPQDREDLAAEVFLAFVADDFAILRRFRGECSLATYLTVVVRRIVVRELMRRKDLSKLAEVADEFRDERSDDVESRIADQEEVARLLDGLNDQEAAVVRKFHLEGKTYQEISSEVGLPENSIGPTLSRARTKMRNAAGETVPQ